MMQQFNRFKHLSLNLLHKTNRDNVNAIKEAISEYPKDVIQPLFEFIYIPLKSVLENERTKNSPDLDISVMECLTKLMATGVHEISKDVISVLETLSRVLINRAPKEFNEEWHAAFVQLLNEIFGNLSENQMKVVYRRDSLLLLSHFVFYIVQLIENNEQNVSSKVETLRTLSKIVSIEKGWSNELVMSKGDVLASTLPGIVTALYRIMTSADVKSKRRLKQTALNVLQELLATVFCDDFLERSKSSRKVTKNDQAAVGDPRIPYTQRDEEWLAEAAQRLNSAFTGNSKFCRVLLQNIPIDGWRVKLAAARFCQRMVQDCSSSLAVLRPALMECLLCLSQDEYESVASNANSALTKIIENQQLRLDLESLCLSTVVESATSITNLLYTVEDSEKIVLLRLLSAAIARLDADQIRCWVTADVQLVSKFITNLAHLMDMDASEIALLEEVHYDESLLQESGYEGLFQKHFVYFRDPSVFNLLSAVVGTLGQRGDISLLLFECHEQLRQNGASRSPLVLLSRLLLDGYLKEETTRQKDKISTIEPFLDCLLDGSLLETQLSIWDEEVVSDTRETDLQPRRVKQNIQVVCLVMETLAMVSKFYRGGMEEHFLLRGLYPILALLAGRSPALVVHSAQGCLQKIAAVCGHPNTYELLLANADYLLDGLSRRLRRLHRYPDSPRVLIAILDQGSDRRILPLVTDSVEEMLLELDEVYEERSCLFLPAFVSLMKALRRWFGSEATLKIKKHETIVKPSILEESLSYIRQQQRDRELARKEFVETEDQEAVTDSGVEVDDDQKVVEPHHKLAESVVRRCGHLLAAESPQLRLLSLNAIREGCLALTDCESLLLPFVHFLWPSLLNRLRDEEPNVVLAAFHLLTTLAETTGDFIRSRATTDLVSRMTEFLSRQASFSYKVKSPVYKFSSAFKIQRHLLQNIGMFGVSIRLQSYPLERLIASLIPYLSSHQPQQLRQASFESVETLYEYDPGLVWYHLYLLNPSLMTPENINDHYQKSEFDLSLTKFLTNHSRASID